MKRILTIAAMFAVLGVAAVVSLPASAQESPCCAQVQPERHIIGYKKVPIYAQTKQVVSQPQQPCCVTPQPVAKETEVPVVEHIQPVVIVEPARIVYAQQPHVQLPPDCPPWMRRFSNQSGQFGRPAMSFASNTNVRTGEWSAKTHINLACTGQARGAPFLCGNKSPTGFCICP